MRNARWAGICAPPSAVDHGQQNCHDFPAHPYSDYMQWGSAMSKPRFNRRQFLESTSRTVAATSLTACLPAVAAGGAPPKALDAYTATVLTRVCRVMFPHDALNDSYYATCVEGLDEKAANDAEVAALLTSGVEALDGAGTGKFTDMDASTQTETLAAMEGTPFFSAIQGHVVVALYNNPKVWPQFGYEGASFPFGGYLDRGFDDIDWLPTT